MAIVKGYMSLTVPEIGKSSTGLASCFEVPLHNNLSTTIPHAYSTGMV